MKILFLAVGKGHESYVREGVEDFTNRIGHYFPVSWNILQPPKNAGTLTESDLRKKEGESILHVVRREDFVVALDERGKQLNSVGLATYVQSRANESVKQLIFLIGGAYGLDATVKERAAFEWSLSQLVFPHQLVRLILAEQVYRACTIIRKEKYHHS